jgi:hypothetical protein
MSHLATLIYEPSELPRGPFSAGPERYEEFLGQLSTHLGAKVPLIETHLRDLDPQGFVLLHAGRDVRQVLADCAPEIRKRLVNRLIPLAVSHAHIFELLEELSLPAAVGSLSLSEWEAREPDDVGACGPHGLRDVAKCISAGCVELYESKSNRYCYLESPTHHGLPHLLADYLRAYAALFPQ